MKHELIDVAEPNLLREQFPYDAVPRIIFDGEFEQPDPAPDFFITDTTFRDGQQARPPYTAGQIVAMFDMLHRLGGPSGVIRQTEFFLYSKVDREAVNRCLARGYEFPEVTGWIRAVESGLQDGEGDGPARDRDSDVGSDYHIFNKLKKTRRAAMDDYLEIVNAALDAGLRIRCHLEDATRADFYGFVVPFVSKLMELGEASGIPVKIRVCDTLGFGVPYPGVALPRSVPKLILGLRRECGVKPEQLEWHGHNDFHKVLANATAAWLYGCMYANGTILGYGERTGNPPLGRAGDGLRVAQGRRERDGLVGDHRNRGVLRARSGLPDSRQLSVCGARLQRDARGDSCRRAAEGRGNLQRLRHGEDSWPAAARRGRQNFGRGRGSRGGSIRTSASRTASKSKSARPRCSRSRSGSMRSMTTAGRRRSPTRRWRRKCGATCRGCSGAVDWKGLRDSSRDEACRRPNP